MNTNPKDTANFIGAQNMSDIDFPERLRGLAAMSEAEMKARELDQAPLSANQPMPAVTDADRATVRAPSILHRFIAWLRG